mgnify:CR=1 FL=1
MSLNLNDDEINNLCAIGFTKTQAKLYLSLLFLGKTDGRMLSKHADLPRPMVYRSLEELQKMGLVERELAVPFKFIATPLKEGLNILLNLQLSHYEEKRDNIERFILKNQYMKHVDVDENTFLTFEGKDKIIQRIKHQHDAVKERVDVLSTPQRWFCIIDNCFENYKKALERGTKYRIVISKEDETKINFSKNVHLFWRTI